MEDRIWYLKQCDLLCELDAEQLRFIERHSKIKRFQAGTPIYLPLQPADAVLLVAEGLVKLCHLTSDGKAATLAFVAPGEVFGELSLVSSDPRSEYCEAVESTTLVRIPREVIQELMQSTLDIALRVTKIVGLRRIRIENRLRNLLFTSNQERLTHLLLDLAEQFGKRADDGLQLRLKLSHQELANLIGTTRETVTILLGKMKSAGLVHGRRQTIILPDAARLARSVNRSWQHDGK